MLGEGEFHMADLQMRMRSFQIGQVVGDRPLHARQAAAGPEQDDGHQSGDAGEQPEQAEQTGQQPLPLQPS